MSPTQLISNRKPARGDHPAEAKQVWALLVEDSEDDALLLRRQLERAVAGVHIERVEDGEGLKAALERKDWDIVISDFQLPNFDGLAALKQVRASNSEVPFIMVSATIGEEVAVGAMGCGATDYVMKGNLARLVPVVQRELRGAELRRKHLAALHQMANYDSITGLANRTLFVHRLARFIEVAAREKGQLAVAVIDIDRFRGINDSLGRAAGDALLAQLGVRFEACAGDSTHVARVAADQFAIAYPELKNEGQVAHAMQDLVRSCVGEPFHMGAGEYRITAKAGIALFPEDGGDADVLLRNAGAAVAKAKASAEQCLFYTEQMTGRIAQTLMLENSLRHGIENEEFELHYQPKVSMHERRIVAVEALIRWRSPELGLVPPAQFIPLLEDTGMIVEVGAWVLNQAVRDHSHWRALGIPPPRVAVNVSAVQLGRHDFVTVVKNAIAFGRLPPGIDLEITESLLVGDVGSSIGKLAAVRDLGLNIAIDDFGTGYSSLGYLAKMPLESLKIDRSFVAAMLTDPRTHTLVATIINMAHSLGLVVVAEGVETEAQAAELLALECDQMQGYLVGKPLPRDEMTLLLEASARLRR